MAGTRKGARFLHVLVPPHAMNLVELIGVYC